MSAIGWGLIAVFLALAALHLYWGLGGFWPGRDADSLRLLVVGTPAGPMYGLAACAAVAAALTGAAAVIGAGHMGIASGGLRSMIVCGYIVLIAVFGLRGLAPYVTSIFDYARGSSFFELNRTCFSPLCLAIAAALTADFYAALIRVR